MSIKTITYIDCEAFYCGERRPICDDDADPVRQLRDRLIGLGWRCDNTGDWCPKHVDMAEAKADDV